MDTARLDENAVTTFRGSAFGLALSVWLSAPGLSAAQSAQPLEVGVTVQGLVSVQPAADYWVGSPYLDRGRGGVAPGVSVGVDVTARRVALAVEYSTPSTIEVIQRGRLITGPTEGS